MDIHRSGRRGSHSSPGSDRGNSGWSEMNALEFVTFWPEAVEQIAALVKPELSPVVDRMRRSDPHDLISPDVWFPNDTAAYGFVWHMFVGMCEKTECEMCGSVFFSVLTICDGERASCPDCGSAYIKSV